MVKIKVLILKNVSGVDDGQVYPTAFKEGDEVSIGLDLFKSFNKLGVVETNLKKNEEETILGDSKEVEVVEDKVIEQEYEKKIIPKIGLFKKKIKKGGKK